MVHIEFIDGLTADKQFFKMAHFAQLDEANIVLNVVRIGNDEIKQNGNEVEEKGIELLKQFHGNDTVWVQTSYNNNFRFRYAIIGGSYDSGRDAFLLPKTSPDHVLNEETLEWELPANG